MSNVFLRRLLASTTLCTVAIGSSAMAQTAPTLPPVFQTIDEHGVELRTGRLVRTLASVAIGNGGPGSLGYNWTTDPMGQRSDITGYISIAAGSGGAAYVNVGGSTETFTQNGVFASATYTQDQGSNSTLTYDSSSDTFTYTRGAGTVITFKQQGGLTGQGYKIQSATYPSGEVLQYYYTVMSVSYPGGPLNTAMLQSITSSLGYQLRLIYSLINGGNFVTSTVAFNMANETCDPAAASCTLTGSWPTASVDYSTYNYTNSNGLLVHEGGDSTHLTFTYPSGRVETYTGHYGTSSYGYTPFIVSSYSDGKGTWSYQFPYNNTLVYHPDSPAPKDYQFNSAGRVGYNDDADSGITLSYGFDSKSRITSRKLIANSTGLTSEADYTYDARGNLILERDISTTPGTPVDILKSAHYPATCSNVKTCNKPDYTIDANGNQTDYTYDPTHGGVTSVTEPAAVAGGVRPQIRFSYTPLSANYRNGSGSIISGPAAYRLTAVSQCQTTASCAGTADEVKTTTIYDPNSALLPVSTTTASGDGLVSTTTATTYYPTGDVNTVDGPLPTNVDTTRHYYDAGRRPTGIIGPDPDGSGPLKRRAIRLTYAPDGQLATTEQGTAPGQGDGDMASFASLQTRATTFDAQGRPATSSISAAGATTELTQMSYNNAGTLQCQAVRMNSAAFGSLPTSACTQTAGTPGPYGPDRITQYAYDWGLRPTSMTTQVGTAQAQTETAISYAPLGQVETLTDANGNKTTYKYDGFNRPWQTFYPSPTTAGTSSTTDYEQLGYDPSDNVVSRRLRDGTSATFDYDLLNRLKKETPPGSEPVTNYTYDLLGRLTLASQPATGISHTLTWDALSELRGETQPFGTVSYKYDQAGRRRMMIWSDGFFVNYDHAVTGEVTAIRENGVTSGVGVLATYSYNDLAQRTGITRGNGTTTTYTYDSAWRLSSLSHNLSGSSYDYGAGFSSYNPAGQIGSTTRTNDVYAYGGSANMDKPYTVNGLNQATSSNSYAITYDTRGNLNSAAGSAGTSTYGYNSANLMTSASGGVTLYYDAFDRVVEYDTSVSTRYVFDGQNVVSEVSNPSSAIQRRYVYGPGSDEPIVWYEGSGTSDRRWLHADERGSVVAISDGSGTAIAVNSYDEYGVPASGNIGRFQYTGQAWLPELGLYNYKARMYSSRLGRFMQTDPIGYRDGMNWYNYTRSDPVNSTDPNGLLHSECSNFTFRYENPFFPQTSYSTTSQDCQWIPDYSDTSPSPTYEELPFALPNHPEEKPKENPCEGSESDFLDGLEYALDFTGTAADIAGLGLGGAGVLAAEAPPVAAALEIGATAAEGISVGANVLSAIVKGARGNYVGAAQSLAASAFLRFGARGLGKLAEFNGAKVPKLAQKAQAAAAAQAVSRVQCPRS